MKSKEEMQMANMLSAMMPKEMLIEMLEESILKWKIDSTKKNFHSVASICGLTIMKAVQEQESSNSIGGMAKISEMIDSSERAKDLLDRVEGKQS